MKSIGKINYGSTTAEKSAKKRRRILYFNLDMRKGERISYNSLVGLRGGKGINMNLKKYLLVKKSKSTLKIEIKN